MVYTEGEIDKQSSLYHNRFRLAPSVAFHAIDGTAMGDRSVRSYLCTMRQKKHIVPDSNVQTTMCACELRIELLFFSQKNNPVLKRLRDGPRPTREILSYKNVGRYVLTFTLLFDVHLVQLVFLYRIRTKFLSACAFYKTFSIKKERRENHDYYVQSVIETLSKSCPLGLKPRISRFVYMFFHLRS
jgi:hypothetical protein